MDKKLDSGEKHFLRLIRKEQDCPDGWARVSKAVYPLVKKMPPELVQHEPTEDGRGRAKLTERGEAILDAMDWL